MLLCQGGFLEMTSLISSKGNNMMRLKQENQSSIRKIIYLRGPVLRSSIAEDLHLTLPTITTNVNAMLQRDQKSEDQLKAYPIPERDRVFLSIFCQNRHLRCRFSINGYILPKFCPNIYINVKTIS